MVMAGRCNFQSIKPTMVMVFVQIIVVGFNVLFKLADEDGMKLEILVAYRCIVATIFLVPFALFVERNRPKLTTMVIFQAFICGLLWGPLTQNLYVSSLKLTSATFITAMTNLIPAITYILAVILRLERLGITTIAGKAKLLGTVTGIGGAMVLTFYKGEEINLWSTKVNLTNWIGNGASIVIPRTENLVGGLLLAIGCCLAEALWLILQAIMGKSYPCYLSMTAMVSFMGSIQSVIYALCKERKWKEWKLGWNFRLWTVAYVGIVGMALMFILIAWTIRERGPLFVSVFNPLALVLMAITGSLILDEELHVGSLVGAALIVVGLYMVLWGKSNEMKRISQISIESEHIEEVLTPITSSSPTAIDTSINKHPDVNISDDASHNPIMIGPAISVAIEEEEEEDDDDDDEIKEV